MTRHPIPDPVAGREPAGSVHIVGPTDDGFICRRCGQWFPMPPPDSEPCPGSREPAGSVP